MGMNPLGMLGKLKGIADAHGGSKGENPAAEGQDAPGEGEPTPPGEEEGGASGGPGPGALLSQASSSVTQLGNQALGTAKGLENATINQADNSGELGADITKGISDSDDEKGGTTNANAVVNANKNFGL